MFELFRNIKEREIFYIAKTFKIFLTSCLKIFLFCIKWSQETSHFRQKCITTMNAKLEKIHYQIFFENIILLIINDILFRYNAEMKQ